MKQIFEAKNAPKAIGPYSHAASDVGIVFLSGQIPINPKTGELESGITAQTERVFENIAAVLEEAGLSFGDVLKTTVFLADIKDFAVVNEIYARYFSAPYPARSAVQVAALPKGASVEIECVAAKK
jgi:2-iminobutanoate/2-iminopropanoate deaminase